MTKQTTQHTPSPWRARLVHSQMEDPGSTLARVGPKLPDGRQWMVFSDADRGDPEADARLMAAAPKLLSVVEDLEWGLKTDAESFCPMCFDPRQHGHSPRCALGAALAAARGEHD